MPVCRSGDARRGGEIDGFCNWDGGKSSYNKRHPDEPVTWEVHIPSGYHDKEGQIFYRGSGFC